MDPSEAFDLYYTKALKFLSYRPRSEKEVRDNLLRKKADPDIIDGVIELLTKQKFLNDTEFAAWWVRQRIDFKPRSYSFIKRELIQKGIAKEIIENVIQKKDEEKVDDLQMAKTLVKKRIGKYKNVEKNIVYQKLGHYLAQKGFNWDTIRRAIDDSLK